MGFHKYASFEVLSAVQIGGRGKTAQHVGFRRSAHRHAFEYDPKPGYLYVRSRAISSRCNDNFDEFPAEEIKTAYRTFVGKPVFVNHVNENHRRARGVIIDAALHEDTNPDGSPDTWCEVLMEVDAVKFPRLSEAILNKWIERTSMGTDVAYSVCSFCGNKASTPLEYCAHIPKLKGKRIYRTTASGDKEGILVREICHGLSFFENSLLVEEPADPTAYFLGVDTRGLTGHLAKAARFIAEAAEWDEKEHPRGQPTNRGQFAEKPGVVAPGNPDSDDKPKGKDKSKGMGLTKDDPIKTSDPVEAATALAEGRFVRLEQPRQVSTLLDELAKMVQQAKAAGASAPVIDLCRVTVENTNLFCVESKGIPRIKMPQLVGKPIAGSKADELPKNDRGEVDIQENFRHSLLAGGFQVERGTEKAAYLKASQNELNGAKVAGMVGAMEAGTMTVKGAPVFVSNDNYIVDGHHRWAALVGLDLEDNVAGDVDMDIDRVDMDIITLLQAADEFAREWGLPGAGLGESAEDAAARAAQPVAASLRKSASLIRRALEEDSTVCTGSGSAPVDGVCPKCGYPIRTEGGLVVQHARVLNPGGSVGGDWLSGWAGSKKTAGIKVHVRAPQLTKGFGDNMRATHMKCSLDVSFTKDGWEAKISTPGSYYTFDESGPIEKTKYNNRGDVAARADFGKQWREHLCQTFVWTAIKYSVSPPWPEPEDVEIDWTHPGAYALISEASFAEFMGWGSDTPKVTKPTVATWRPVMRREDAQRWAGRGKWAGPWYHGTSAQGSQALLTQGFSQTGKSVADKYGPGIYLTKNRAEAARYGQGVIEVWTKPGRVGYTANYATANPQDLVRQDLRLPPINDFNKAVMASGLDAISIGDAWLEVLDPNDIVVVNDKVDQRLSAVALLINQAMDEENAEMAKTAGSWVRNDFDRTKWHLTEWPYVATIYGNKDARHDHLIDYTFTASIMAEGYSHTLTHGREPSLTVAKTLCARAIGEHKSKALTAVAAGEQIAPAQVDTLREELCPVCGETDTYDGERCQVCGFVKPPDEFMDPDLEEAKRNDLRQEDDDAVPTEDKNLTCDNCGANFKGAPADGEQVTEKPTAPVVPDKTPVEVVDEQKPAKEVLRDRNTLPKPKKDEDQAEQKGDQPGQPQEDEEVDAEEPETAPRAGDTCPDCGKGKLQEAAPKPMDGPDDADQVGEEDDEESEEDDEDDNPFAKKDGDDKPPSKKKKKSGFPPKKTQKEQSMRPALAALVEQQKVIEQQDQRLARLEDGLTFVATLAGVQNHPKLAGLIRTADDENPAQPLPDPAAEAPTETTQEALQPQAKDDVASVGPTPLTDVSPDATADVTEPTDSSGKTNAESTPVDTTPPAPDLAPIGGSRKQGEATVLDEPLDLNEVDVTAPVAGTEEPRPLDEVKIETEQRMGEGTQDVAFPLQGPFAEKATAARAMAGLRLARLRMQAGITAATDDLTLGEEIAVSAATDDAIQTEITTLAAVLAARPRQQAQARRNLVPRQAASATPSFQEPVIPVQEVVSAVNDTEFLFE